LLAVDLQNVHENCGLEEHAMTERKLGEGKEKRQVERKYLVFYLRVFDCLSAKVLGHVVNISSKGLMLLSDNAIPVNQEYQLKMQLPSEVSDLGEIIFNAVSCWCKQDRNPDFYVAGFKIHDLNESGKNDVLHLIDDFGFIDS
jgi:hypothetical protein